MGMFTMFDCIPARCPHGFDSISPIVLDTLQVVTAKNEDESRVAEEFRI